MFLLFYVFRKSRWRLTYWFTWSLLPILVSSNRSFIFVSLCVIFWLFYIFVLCGMCLFTMPCLGSLDYSFTLVLLSMERQINIFKTFLPSIVPGLYYLYYTVIIPYICAVLHIFVTNIYGAPNFQNFPSAISVIPI